MQIILRVSQIRRQLKRLFICLMGLLFLSNIAIAQEVLVPESEKTIPNAKCFWGYGVRRLSTTHDTTHNYIIQVSLHQKESIGNNEDVLQLKNALIYCSFSEKGVTKTIYCKQNGFLWIARFEISTSQPLQLKLILL